MGIFVIIFCAAAAAFTTALFERRNRKKQLLRIRHMVEQAKSGSLRPETMDESLISSVENDVMQFLQSCTVSEEKLQEQKNEIQTLISDISHQTTTPLSNIMIYSQLLEEVLAGKEGFEAASIIRGQTEKLDFLLKSLVKASRLETGIIAVTPVRCNLTEILMNVKGQAEMKAAAKNIELIFDRQDVPVFAMCDPKWTAEACFNIVDNAVKYTGQGGRTELSITPYTMFVRIDIRDNGMGISEDEIPKVFRRFYRSSLAAGEEGVGLGLFLARQIVQAQGGYIKVSSKPGKGSLFSLFLPMAED